MATQRRPFTTEFLTQLNNANKFSDLIGGQTGNDNYQFSQMHRESKSNTHFNKQTNTYINELLCERVSVNVWKSGSSWMADGLWHQNNTLFFLDREFRVFVTFKLSVSHWACAFRIPHPAQAIKNDFKNKTIKASVPCWRFGTSDRMVLSRQPTKLNIQQLNSVKRCARFNSRMRIEMNRRCFTRFYLIEILNFFAIFHFAVVLQTRRIILVCAISV